MEKTQEYNYRIEKDSIGSKDVPVDVYYGVQSLRAAENFHITGLNMHPEIIKSVTYIKKASAITNCDTKSESEPRVLFPIICADVESISAMSETYSVSARASSNGTSLISIMEL